MSSQVEPEPEPKQEVLRVSVTDLPDHVGLTVEVNGWVTTTRQLKKVGFIKLVDGSSLADVQLVLRQVPDYALVGSSLRAVGQVVQSRGPEQPFEIQVTHLEPLGTLDHHDASTYLLAKTSHSMEYLRQIPHMRIRTKLFQAIMRIRNCCSKATHDFFQEKGYVWMHTPLITTSDCEGAGEVFGLTSSSDTKEVKFFNRQAYLTVSGQLHGESYASALGKIYTFGPTFRAEHSKTNRHLAEFWMIEPEVAFCEYHELLQLAEDYILYCIQEVLRTCQAELKVCAAESKGLIERLTLLTQEEPKRLTYTEAISDLQSANISVQWGDDLSSDMEKKLVADAGGCMVTVIQYPRALKSFYMRDSAESKDTQQTVDCMDILVPGIGELVGGSMRESDYKTLLGKMQEKGLDSQEYDWYLDLRRYGSVEHGGFGLGFERLVQLVTGVANIRDTIPFPRAYQSLIG